jgi:hypothetical protein
MMLPGCGSLWMQPWMNVISAKASSIMRPTAWGLIRAARSAALSFTCRMHEQQRTEYCILLHCLCNMRVLQYYNGQKSRHVCDQSCKELAKGIQLATRSGALLFR